MVYEECITRCGGSVAGPCVGSDGIRSGTAGSGASTPPSVITTLAGDVQADWAVQKELVVNAADAMPNDKFGYKSACAAELRRADHARR